MKKNKYISIGKSILSKDLFKPIINPLDNYSFKPDGGLWSSKYIDDPKECLSEWYKYLFYDDNKNKTFFRDWKNACLFTLKENAKILKIDNFQNFLSLTNKYPYLNKYLNNINPNVERYKTVDFQKLADVYDGVFVDIWSLNFYSDVFSKWFVPTLLLFNLDCINNYDSAIIKWSKDPFLHSWENDLDCNPKLIITNQNQKVSEYTKDFLKLLNIARKNLKSTYKHANYESYDSYLSSAITDAKLSTKKAINDNISLYISIVNHYQDNFPISKDSLLSHIASIILSENLKEKQEEIQNLPKSKTRDKKSFRQF